MASNALASEAVLKRIHQPLVRADGIDLRFADDPPRVIATRNGYRYAEPVHALLSLSPHELAREMDRAATKAIRLVKSPYPELRRWVGT